MPQPTITNAAPILVKLVDDSSALTMQYIQLAAVLISLFATIAAFMASRQAKRAANISEHHSSQSMKNEILSMHINFQTEIRNLQKQLPPEVNDSGWVPSKQEKRIIRMYWYAVFDEWLASVKIGANIKHMWDEYYRNGVTGAMTNGAFVDELRVMIAGPTTFLGKPKDFTDELKAIYKEVHGKDFT